MKILKTILENYENHRNLRIRCDKEETNESLIQIIINIMKFQNCKSKSITKQNNKKKKQELHKKKRKSLNSNGKLLKL